MIIKDIICPTHSRMQYHWMHEFLRNLWNLLGLALLKRFSRDKKVLSSSTCREKELCIFSQCHARFRLFIELHGFLPKCTQSHELQGQLKSLNLKWMDAGGLLKRRDIFLCHKQQLMTTAVLKKFPKYVYGYESVFQTACSRLHQVI